MKCNCTTRLAYAFLLISAILLSSCNGGKTNAPQKNQARIKMEKELVNIQRELPKRIGTSSIVMKSINIENDMAKYVLELSEGDWKENFAFNETEANSDRNIARVITNVGDNSVNNFLEAGLGLKYVYLNAETDEPFLVIEAPAERLKEIQKKVASGEVAPYSIMEMFQMEINRYEFPCEVEEGVWLTDGYIRGNTVYYIANIESDITSDDVSYSEVQDMKKDLLLGLRESMIAFQKKEMMKEGVRIVYIYKNKNGDEFARVEISADDF